MMTLKCSVAFAALALAAIRLRPAAGTSIIPPMTIIVPTRPASSAASSGSTAHQYGYRDGRISHQAKDRLYAYLRRIKEELHYACEDHRVTRYERRHLRRMLNENSRRIASFRYRERYDYGRRYSYKDVPPPYKSYKDDYREPAYGGDKNDYRRGYEEKAYDGYRDGGSKSLAY